ncbi:MAG: inositol monophosphatase family protein [Anaerolineae bacterium]
MLETAIAAARAAGEVLKERFAQPHEVRSKGLRDLVTEADLLAQDAILGIIRARYPAHQVLSEEAPAAEGADAGCQWFVDPLDGTTNYARGIPIFSVSIAVVAQGDLAVAVVYEPLGDRLFHAVRGQGACLNGQPLRVSARAALIEALLDLGWARSQPARLACLQAAHALGPHIGSARTLGSAALGLAAVAAGWEDVYYHPELAPWDVAAGILLVLEAGGQVSALDGSPWDLYGKGFLASNGVLHRQVLERLNGVQTR